MEKVTLTRVYTTNKDKQGNPLKSAKGYPYTRMSIQCREYGDKWLSGFQNKDNQNWKEGDTIEIIKKQNGQYLNFETPKKEDINTESISKILTKLGIINLKLDKIYDKLLTPEERKTLNEPTLPEGYPTEDINAEDIPF